MVVGLQFGLVVGLVAGLLTFIPYVGALVGGALSVGLALFPFWGDWWADPDRRRHLPGGPDGRGQHPDAKAGGGGSSVGLHPVWLNLRALGFRHGVRFRRHAGRGGGGRAIGVLVRFGAIEKYKSGLLYRGLESPDEEG